MVGLLSTQSSGLKTRNIKESDIHLIIAAILWPLYASLGLELKMIIVVYVGYLIFFKSGSSFPALAVHFSAGTLVSQFILIFSLVYSCAFFARLIKKKVGILFLSYLIMITPIFFVAAVSANSVIDAGVYLNNALSFSAFFYGCLIASQIDERHFLRVLFILFAALVLEALPTVDGTIRLYFLAAPVFFALFAQWILSRGILPRSRWLVVGFFVSLALLASNQITPTFVVIGSCVVAMSFIALNLRIKKAALMKLVTMVSAAASVVITTYVMSANNAQSFHTGIENLASVNSIGGVFESARFKIFGDRGVLWRGVWASLVSGISFFPSWQITDIVFYTLEDAEMEVTYGAHNMFLESLRYYGWFCGAISCVLIFQISIKGVAACLSLRQASLAAVLSAGATALLVFGGTFGHFVFANNISLLLLALVGIGYGMARDFRPKHLVQPQ